jgi:predicted nucleic acid-binding Zn ribbon protein
VPVEKVLYPAAIHFKGSGFYSTDYGRGGRKSAEGVSSDSTPSSSETKSDTPKKAAEA